ncbi:MAG: hypothetical protein LQ347_003334 [Umbilicaria vellea]|nr:MAG: hypothetical protein LQ347_003334 [Umbilicaria vellea]
MPGKWDAELERKLLLSVLEAMDTKPPAWDKVTTSMGPGFTNESCRQRYQKLRKEHAKNALPVTPKVTATPTSAVPRNPKTPKTSETPEATTKSVKSTKAAGNKRKRAVSVELSTHDSDSDAASATINDEGDVIAKKVKVNPGSSEATIIKSVE